MGYHFVSIVMLFIVISLTIYACILLMKMDCSFDVNKASRYEAIEIVWASSWITAAATGLGVFPFVLNKTFDSVYIAVGNAIAAGMMISASIGLIVESLMLKYTYIELEDLIYIFGLDVVHGKEVIWIDSKTYLSWFKSSVPVLLLLIGMFIGAGFIHESRRRLDQYEGFSVMDIHGSDARKVVLIMIVMTMHSMSEGIGIGVSYHSQKLGAFVSATLAVHNVPEGIAISMVMIPRGVSILNTMLWCVFSSIPQPIMAIPSFLFVDKFKPLVPLGLGFAAGAMFYVAFFDLLVEAKEELDSKKIMMVTSTSAALMAIVQVALREDGELPLVN